MRHARPSHPSPARLALGLATGLLLAAAAVAPASALAADAKLLNVSFDISRTLFEQINPAFAAHWARKTGDTIAVQQSHGGSSKQARAVLDGLEADVVTLNQVPDIDILAARGGLLPTDWRERLPHHSSPYSSTVVFLVRRGNPKGIRDWNDLAKPGVGVVLPNPKTSGNGRYSYLAAWAYAQRRQNLNEAETRDFVGRILHNVPVFDTGGRGATTTFAERGIGDVLLTFEAEARFTLRELGTNRLEIVHPSFSVEAEMPVAVVEKYARRKGSEKIARAYLEFLYSEEAQEIIANNEFRPRSEPVARRHAPRFAALDLVRVEDAFGTWAEVNRLHFAEGGVFDQLTQKAL